MNPKIHPAIKTAEKTCKDVSRLVVEVKDMKRMIEDLTDAVFVLSPKDLRDFSETVRKVVLEGDREFFTMLNLKKYQQKIRQEAGK